MLKCVLGQEESYNSVISNPMWLDKVKTKLQEDQYKTMREFVDDINLIFDNSQTFNKVRHISRSIINILHSEVRSNTNLCSKLFSK